MNIIYILIVLVSIDVLITIYRLITDLHSKAEYKQQRDNLEKINIKYYEEIMSLRTEINSLQKGLYEPEFKVVNIDKSKFNKIKAVEAVNINEIDNFNEFDYRKLIANNLSVNLLNEVKQHTHIKEHFDEELNAYVYSCEFWVYEED